MAAMSRRCAASDRRPQGVARRRRVGRWGLVEAVEVLADAADEGQVLALLVVVVRVDHC